MAKIGLLVGPNSELEAMSIRTTAEYFGYHVATHWLGRPQEFIDFLDGRIFDRSTKFFILCFHGNRGRFVMPKLARNLYLKDEPREDFGAGQLEHNTLRKKLILTTACSMGKPEIGRSFQQKNSVFIAPRGYIEGNAALMFVHSFLYMFLENSAAMAFESSKGFCDKDSHFVMYE